MSGYTLTWPPGSSLAKGPTIIDGSLLRPDTLAQLSRDALSRLRFRNGNTETGLGELFTIDGTQGPRLTIRNAPPLDHLGAHMKSGELVIEGDAGDDLGASMQGGSIRVTGTAGHRAGGPAATSNRGMTGGEIIIDGKAGDYSGLRMRRGLIVIRGTPGKSPGYRMMAGTLVLLRGPLDAPGLEMRRGTILSLDRAAAPPLEPAFACEVTFDSSAAPALKLLLRHLTNRGVLTAQVPTRFKLFSGDRSELNKGEIWQAI